MTRAQLEALKAARRYIRRDMRGMAEMACPGGMEGKPDLSHFHPGMKPDYDRAGRLLRKLDKAIGNGQLKR